MLEIFNSLEPFFNDTYREISVREYAREMKISPPTASKELKALANEGLLHFHKRGIYFYFRANKEMFLFKQLAKLYWYSVLQPITEKLWEEIAHQRIILFGSLSKAENSLSSDIDLFLNVQERKIDLSLIEKRTQRKVQLHFINELKNKNLKKNIDEGIIIK